MGGQCSSKRESFHDAILKKDLKKVKYFIQNGLDVKNDLRALEVKLFFHLLSLLNNFIFTHFSTQSLPPTEVQLTLSSIFYIEAASRTTNVPLVHST